MKNLPSKNMYDPEKDGYVIATEGIHTGQGEPFTRDILEAVQTNFLPLNVNRVTVNTHHWSSQGVGYLEKLEYADHPNPENSPILAEKKCLKAWFKITDAELLKSRLESADGFSVGISYVPENFGTDKPQNITDTEGNIVLKPMLHEVSMTNKPGSIGVTHLASNATANNNYMRYVFQPFELVAEQTNEQSSTLQTLKRNFNPKGTMKDDLKLAETAQVEATKENTGALNKLLSVFFTKTPVDTTRVETTATTPKNETDMKKTTPPEVEAPKQNIQATVEAPKQNIQTTTELQAAENQPADLHVSTSDFFKNTSATNKPVSGMPEFLASNHQNTSTNDFAVKLLQASQSYLFGIEATSNDWAKQNSPKPNAYSNFLNIVHRKDPVLNRILQRMGEADAVRQIRFASNRSLIKVGSGEPAEILDTKAVPFSCASIRTQVPILFETISAWRYEVGNIVPKIFEIIGEQEQHEFSMLAWQGKLKSSPSTYLDIMDGFFSILKKLESARVIGGVNPHNKNIITIGSNREVKLDPAVAAKKSGDGSKHLVIIKCHGHGFSLGMAVIIKGTTNYDGKYQIKEALPAKPNEFVIEKKGTFQEETFTAGTVTHVVDRSSLSSLIEEAKGLIEPHLRNGLVAFIGEDLHRANIIKGLNNIENKPSEHEALAKQITMTFGTPIVPVPNIPKGKLMLTSFQNLFRYHQNGAFEQEYKRFWEGGGGWVSNTWRKFCYGINNEAAAVAYENIEVVESA